MQKFSTRNLIQHATGYDLYFRILRNYKSSYILLVDLYIGTPDIGIYRFSNADNLQTRYSVKLKFSQFLQMGAQTRWQKFQRKILIRSGLFCGCNMAFFERVLKSVYYMFASKRWSEFCFARSCFFAIIVACALASALIYIYIYISLVRFRTFCFRSPCRILRAVDNILKRKKNAHIPHLGVSPSPHLRIRSSKMGISGDFNLCTQFLFYQKSMVAPNCFKLGNFLRYRNKNAGEKNIDKKNISLIFFNYYINISGASYEGKFALPGIFWSYFHPK